MTLLELLVVVALMSVVGFMALSQVGDDLSQARYADTANRLEMIRKSIIGDTSRTLNGQPEIRGFVADMGRLPVNLRELIEQPGDCDNDGDPDNDHCDYATYDGHCSDPSKDEATCTGSNIWYPDYGGIWAGWNGPYLSATTIENGKITYRDGWGNESDDSDQDTVNFGWEVIAGDDPSLDLDGDGNAANDTEKLLVVSFGADGQPGSTYGAFYESDYPDTTTEIITKDRYLFRLSDYMLVFSDNTGAGSLMVDFGAPAPAATAFCDKDRDTGYTESSCQSANGTWDEPYCRFDTETKCTAIGGEWRTGYCDLDWTKGIYKRPSKN